MNRGWKRNELGFDYGQVQFVHQTRLTMTQRVNDLMLRGSTFDDAKAKVTRETLASAKALDPAVRKGIQRVAADIRFGDMSRAVHDKAGEDFRQGIEALRGRKMGRIERLFYRVTGWAF